MALSSFRPAAVLLAGALLFLAVANAARSGVAAAPGADAVSARTIDGQPGTALRADRLAQTAVTWRGGAITTSTGAVVEVFVSETLPVESVTPEYWAEFLGNLTHGSELAAVTSYHAPLSEVQQLCGARALGCYSRNTMISLAEPAIDGTTPEEVVRHEYGHHIALYRDNTPWRAIDWGPKRWATAATVCPKVSRGEAHPGDEGRNYALNPGEAWAEVYRLLEERTSRHHDRVVADHRAELLPGRGRAAGGRSRRAPALDQGHDHPSRKTFGKRTPRVWLIPVATPLDGNLRITAALPKGGKHEVALLGPDRKSVIRRGQWFGQRAKRIETTVCGQRSLYVRVTQAGALGRVSVSAATP